MIRTASITALIVSALFLSQPVDAQCTTKAAVNYFGTSMSGQFHKPYITSSGALPKPGQKMNFWLQYVGGAPSPAFPYLLVVGSKRADIPFLGGKLLVDPSTIVATIPGTMLEGVVSYASIRFAIPNNTSLCGKVGVFQFGIFDSFVKSGVVLTHGLEYVVGS